MMLIDTHCHVHDSEFYPDNKEQVYRQARDAGVVMICVGTDVRSSIEAVEFAHTHEGCYAIVGIHPHEAKDSDVAEIRELLQHEQRRMQNREPRTIIGIGEIGLDYFYDHSPQDIQQQVLRQQLQLAVEFALPVSFHIREAFVDFWPIFDEFPDIKGVMHSFTDTRANLKQAMKRGLLVGINGISTFTKDESQQTMFRDLPLQHILLETDAPFLTPKPFRGKMNVPAYVAVIAEHQAALKGITKEEVARVTTANAQELFGI